MRSLLLSLLLATLASAAPPTIKIGTIRSFTPAGSSVVIVVPGAIYTAELASLALEGDTLTLTSSYTEVGTSGPGDSRTYTYKDANGATVTVFVDCKGLSAQPCAEKFAAAIREMLKLVPPKSWD